jgi:hypothetical protein
MTPLTKLALALAMTAGLAAPVYAGSSNFSANTDENGQNAQAGSQAYPDGNGMNANPNAMNSEDNNSAASNNNSWNPNATGANNPNAMNPNARGWNNGNARSVRNVIQKLRGELNRFGFSNINITPGSLIVHAKDSSGNPVVMVISPDSIASFMTESNDQSSANQNSMSNQNSANRQNPNPSGGNFQSDQP